MKRVLVLLGVLITSLFIFAGTSTTLKAESVEGRGLTRARPAGAYDPQFKPTPWVLQEGIPSTGEKYAQAGKLRYGITYTNPIDYNASYKIKDTPERYGTTSNVEYMIDDKVNLNHLFQFTPWMFQNPASGEQYQLSTIAFSLVQTKAEYEGFPFDPEAGMATFTNVEKLGDTIIATGGKYDKNGTYNTINDDFDFKLTMTPAANKSYVRHTYELTNKTEQTQTVYPMRMIDTMLGDSKFNSSTAGGESLWNDDDVPIHSRGPNKGLYIESAENPDDPNKKFYRLDYIFNNNPDDPDYNENAPLYYYGSYQGQSFNKVFGDWGSEQRAPDGAMDQADGTIVHEGTTAGTRDTGMYMSWGKQELEPGVPFKMSYDVAIKPLGQLEHSKTAENITHPEVGAKNLVGDEIEYTVSVTSPTYGVTGLRITDELSWAFEDPDPTDTVEVTDGLGVVTELPMSQVYTKEANPSEETPYVGYLDVPGVGQTGYSLDLGQTITVKFKAKLAAKAAGMDVTNIAKVLAISEEGTDVGDDIEVDTPLPVEDVRPVIVKHVDMNGKPLVPTVEDVSVTGKLGDKKTITPQKINGYTYDHASIADPLDVTITTSDQEVLLYYAENRFTIKQEVVKADQSSATSVKVDDELSYKVTIESQLNSSATYNNFAINAGVSGAIENVGNFKLVSSLNPDVELGTKVNYDPVAGTITATVLPSDNVPSNADLILTYTGKVKSDAEPGDKITAKARANGDYSNGMVATEIKAPDFISNIDAGKLIFKSAPATMDFGSNHGISLLKQYYPLDSKDEKLIVRDLRGSNNQWTMLASVTKVLTNASKGNHELPNALNYKKNGDSLVLSDKETAIVSHTTTSTAEVDISKSWDSTDNQPFVEIEGGAAKEGAYQGEITWTLRDGL